MTDIGSSLERSTEIYRLGSALSMSPERLLESGDPWVASWQIGKSQAEGFAYSFEQVWPSLKRFLYL